MAAAVRSSRLRERLGLHPAAAGLVLLVAGAAVLRFATIADQSYWFDESLTVRFTRAPFGVYALGINGGAEPPLYFALAWVWARIFGDGEAGLRSLSALAGVLTVPVAYSIARDLASRRAGLIAAALVAVSPALIAFSQEARSYALYVLLCATSFMFVVRIRERPTARRYAGWVVASALALTAHYFAVFLVVPEAAWLALRPLDRRRAWIAVGGLGAAMLLLAPLALYQRTHGGGEWIANSPLSVRLKAAAHFLVIGPAPGSRAVYAVVLVWLVAGALLVARADRRTRDGALLASGAAAAVIALPVAGALLGSDYVLDRNLLAAVVPLFAVLAAGLALPGLRRVGPAIAAVVCAGLLVEQAEIARDEDLHRDDWRAVAKALGPARPGRLVSVLPGWQVAPLALYHPSLRFMRGPAAVREVVTITYDGPRPRPGPRSQAPPPPPFRLTRTMRVQRMTLAWFTARAATTVQPSAFTRRGALDGPIRFLD